MIGISATGSPKDGKLRNLVNLGIKEFDIKSKLEEIYDTEIKIKNDGKCAGLAEKKYGNLKEYKDCVFLCIGTGVGSSVFLNNQLLEASNYTGFELGHMIINKDGIECNCGNKGCFETYASMKRFKRNTIKELGLEEGIQSEEMQEYIRNNMNDPRVNEWVNKYLDNVVIGLLNIINIFEPEAICFGGSFSYYDDMFLPILKEKLDKERFNKDGNIELVVAKLKNDAGIIGATLL
jgi:glucokinase